MKRLLFIPQDYEYVPYKEFFVELCKQFYSVYYTDQTTALDFKPDYVFVHSSAINPFVLIELKEQCNCYIIQWTGDIRPEPLEQVLNYKGIADLTLLASGIGQKEMYEKAMNGPVNYLQHFVSQSQYIPVNNEPNNNILFIGNAYSHFPGGAERNELCAKLSGLYPNFEVIGNGFNTPEYNNHRTVLYNDTQPLYNSAYISISANIYNDCEGYWSNRPLNIMAAGGCCLMRYVPGMERVFKDGEHCVFYKSNEEAVEKIEILVNDKELRNKIAAAGQKLVMEFHSDKYRVGEIKKYLDL